jgi:hypothetical protein
LSTNSISFPSLVLIPFSPSLSCMFRQACRSSDHRVGEDPGGGLPPSVYPCAADTVLNNLRSLLDLCKLNAYDRTCHV